jgi:hypothetical protein
MIARFDWRWRPSDTLRPANRATAEHPSRSINWLWWSAGGLTAVFISWIFYRLLFRPIWLAQLPATWSELLALSETAWAFTLSFLWAAMGWRFLIAPARRLPPPLPALSVADLYALSPAEFEQYVGQLFRRKGYQVKWRGRSGDHGVDLEVTHPGGKRAIVQCKRYQNTVGPEVVRELYGTFIHERAAHAFLVTTADISTAARAWARGKPMTLIDGPTLTAIAATLQNA